MKKITTLILFALLSVSNVWADVEINEARFPDAAFRSYVSSQFDTDRDGKLSTAEIAEVTGMQIEGSNYKSLQGIGVFTELSGLNCIETQITSLNLSGNKKLYSLYCENSSFSSLTVSGLTELTTLYCNNNQLTSLDLSGCTALSQIDCSSNKLTSLDVSGCTALSWINCCNNQLTSLDLSDCFSLETLFCFDNQLTSLDVSGRSMLSTFECYNNKLTTLNASGCTALEYIYCYNNQLTSLDVSNCSNMWALVCYNNNFNAEALDALLEENSPSGSCSLYLFGDNDNSLYLNPVRVAKANAKGWYIYKSTEDGGGQTYTGEIRVNEKDFPDANFRSYLQTNYGSYDGKQLAAITTMNVASQNIKSLKGIELFTELLTLDCQDNQLTSLEFSDYSKLVQLYFYQNQIKGDAMDALISSLPSSRYSSLRVIYNQGEGNVMTEAQVVAAKAKGWNPQYYDGYTWEDYNGSDPSVQDVVINETNFPDENFRNYLISQSYGSDGILTSAEIKSVKYMSVYSKGIKSLKGIEFFIELTSISCYSNQLSSIDVSKNTKLTSLSCDHNQLTSLNVSNNTELTSLSCYNNLLTSLDVSKNTALTHLICIDNSLTSLDLSNNIALRQLSCFSNQLTTLNVSNCTSLSLIECYSNQIKDTEMDAFVASLPTVTSKQLKIVYDTNEKNVMTIAQVAAAKAKGWTPYYYYNSTWTEYEGHDPSLNIEINETNFPDANFRSWLLEQDYGSDGVLTNTEIAGITDINVFMKDIANLEGIGYFKELRKLRCDQNRLTSLDVSECKKLYDLTCNSNQLTSLNVTGCTELQSLYCYSNQLTTLDVSGCSKLSFVQCYRNNIRGTAMDAFIESLPTVAYSYSLNVIDDVYDQNVMTTTQVAAAKAKGWIPKSYKNYSWEEYEGSAPVVGTEINEKNFPDANFRNWILSQDYGKDGMLTEEEIASVTRIIVSGKSIQSMQGIEFFTALTILNCYNNQLSSLDVSKNTALTTLTCNSNELTSIKVSNTALNNLLIYCNKIKDAAMDALVESLPTVSSGNMYVIYDWNEQNEMTTTQVAAAKAKGWMPKYMGYDSASGRYTWLDYAGSEPTPEILRGDVNGDGEVDMDDATFITNIILGIEDATKAADVNNDGVISMPDAMFIVNKILNGKFPDEE